MIATSELTHLKGNPDPRNEQVGQLDGLFGVFGLLAGAGIGGVSGTIGGSILGAGLAARKK
jgi:hypothetical protein